MILYHAANNYRSDNERDRERMDRAQQTWAMMISVNSDRVRPAYSRQYQRTAKDLGDQRAIPFVKDVIEVGIKKCSKHDAVMLTNADSSLCQETPDFVFDALFRWGCCFSSRMDMDKPHRGWLHHRDIVERGQPFVGVDLVAFTREWWLSNEDRYPDMLMGFSGWDWIFKYHIGVDREIPTVVWHEFHGVPLWHMQYYTSAGQQYNRRLAMEWVKSRPDYLEIKKKWPDVDKLDRPPLKL